jgi:DNA-binding LacI/PurR family transcriptional regulator
VSELPKYEAVAAALREEIGALTWQGKRRLESERELTQRFGVDRSTIRRALEVLEADGLILRRPGRKTEILPGSARQSSGSRQIAFVVDASPRGWATLPAMHGAESVLTPRGFHLTVYSTHSGDPFQSERRERERLDDCLSQGASGVILWPATRHGNADALQRLVAARIPVVLVDHQLPEPGLDFVGIDNVAAAYRATQHLIQAGHRRIAHFTRANTMPTTLQRIEGYCRALEDHALPFDDDWLKRCPPGSRELGALDALLRSGNRPTALLAINDMTALRLLHHLVRRQIRVPDEVAVVGIDDLSVADLTAVPLTTVHQPFEEIGAEAARLLMDRIEGRLQGPPEVRLLPTRLVVRASCGASVAEARLTDQRELGSCSAQGAPAGAADHLLDK